MKILTKPSQLTIGFLVLLLVSECHAVFDPFTVASVVGAAAVSGLLGGGFYIVKCKFMECCEKEFGWLKDDFNGLEKDLSEALYGQHLAKQSILNALKNHWLSQSPAKALVMSFHGATGTGKNYVSTLIVNRLYREGHKSNYVKLWIGKKDFKHESEKQHYADVIQKGIEEQVKKCARSIFIIDEVDVVDPYVIDAIKPYLDHYEHINGVDYRKAIFIFLSNTGAQNIFDILFQKIQNNGKREEISLQDFQHDIENGAFNEKGGLKNGRIIKNGLIDIFVPFLPMEKEHVEKCILDILKKKRCPEFPAAKITEIASKLTYSPPKYEYFSKTGCKTLETTVGLYLRHDCIYNKVVA